VEGYFRPKLSRRAVRGEPDDREVESTFELSFEPPLVTVTGDSGAAGAATIVRLDGGLADPRLQPRMPTLTACRGDLLLPAHAAA